MSTEPEHFRRSPRQVTVAATQMSCDWNVAGNIAKAEKLVREKGEIIKTAAGNIIQNPYLSIANRALDQLNKLGAEFGMTPSSRSRVKTDLVDPDQELERMLFGSRVRVGQ